jgi:hypothetical protein
MNAPLAPAPLGDVLRPKRLAKRLAALNVVSPWYQNECLGQNDNWVRPGLLASERPRS